MRQVLVAGFPEPSGLSRCVTRVSIWVDWDFELLPGRGNVTMLSLLPGRSASDCTHTHTLVKFKQSGSPPTLYFSAYTMSSPLYIIL